MRRPYRSRRAVEGPRVLAASRVFLERDEHAAPIRGLRKNLKLSTAAQSAIAGAASRGDETGEASQPLGPAERLKIFVQNLAGGGPFGRGCNDVVLLLVRTTVESIESDCCRRNVAAVVAGVAGHKLCRSEIGAIDDGHHLHHFARGLFSRSIYDPIDFVGAGAGMTVRAVQAQVGGNHAHYRDKIVHAEPLERAGGDILEGFSGGLLFR